MRAYVSRRLLLLFPTLFLASVLVFLAMRVVPGNVAAAILGDDATPESVANLEEQLGLDRPLVVQYLSWIFDFLRFDLGNSLLYRGVSVSELVSQSIPVTITLAIYGMALTILLSLPAGVYLSLRPRSWTSRILRLLTIAGLSIPTFWLGILLLFLFLTLFSWTPAFRYISFFDDPWGNLTTFILPAFVMAFYNIGVVARVLRSQMLEVIRQDYIRTAHAKGLKPGLIAWRHAVPNALLPVLTVAGSQFTTLIGGLVVVERLFNLPGLGTLMINGATGKDYILVQSLFLLIVAMVLVVNLGVDLLYGLVDPRVRVSSR